MRTLPFIALLGVLALVPLSSCTPSEVDEECVPECGEQVCGREPKCGARCGTCPLGFACSSDGLACLAPPAIGEACLVDEQCGTGRFCLQPSDGAPGGYCTALCSEDHLCPDGAICRPGPGGENVCHAVCDSPESGCRVAEGYVCTDEGFCPTCVPSCDGKSCGSDGCGGWCGSCPADGRDFACDGGQCSRVFTSAGVLPRARWEMGAAVLDGAVYLVGGLRERAMIDGSAYGESVDWVSRFNPDTGEIQQLDDFALPVPLASPHVFSARGSGQDSDRLYVVGGVTRNRTQVKDEDTEEISVVETVKPSRQFFQLVSGAGAQPEWAEQPGLPEKEASIGSAAVVLNGSIYFFSGETAKGLSTGGYRHDLPPDPGIKRWEPISSERRPRHSMTAATDGRYIWLFGGWDGRYDLRLIERYDPVTDTWTEVGQLPFGVSRARALTVDGRIFLFGGEGASLVPLVVFDPVWETAYQLGTAYQRLVDQAPVETRAGVLLFGGMRRSANQPVASGEILRFAVPRP